MIVLRAEDVPGDAGAILGGLVVAHLRSWFSLATFIVVPDDLSADGLWRRRPMRLATKSLKKLG
jgi:hypothetical protein